MSEDGLIVSILLPMAREDFLGQREREGTKREKKERNTQVEKDGGKGERKRGKQRRRKWRGRKGRKEGGK